MMQNIPLGVFTDSYKASHPPLYPEDTIEQVAYGEFRCSYDHDSIDHRILFYGLSYIIDTYIARQWTRGDLEKSLQFYSTHGPGYTMYPFPYELFKDIVEECNGWLPLWIEGLPEGSIIYPHTPVYTITAEKKYSGLVTWLETLLTMVWYPTTVGTLSRRTRDAIQRAFDESVEFSSHYLIDSRLHDFGFRGCATVEQAMIGGAAHLLSFTGTDTAVAAYHVQFNLNNNAPIGVSIPATEHSVMLAHQSEYFAVIQTIRTYGQGAYAIVMDSYDYASALEEIIPSVKSEKMTAGGFMVIRPDSGDPIQSVLSALKALNGVFGSTLNALGYKVLSGCGVIQGDGINYATINAILDAVLTAGYSAQNVAFGMGSSLLHRVNRDTMSFATKLCFARSSDGVGRSICKTPKTDPAKISLPGPFIVLRACDTGIITVHPANDGDLLLKTHEKEKAFIVYYDHGPVQREKPLFKQIRAASLDQWKRAPKILDPVCMHKLRAEEFTMDP